MRLQSKEKMVMMRLRQVEQAEAVHALKSKLRKLSKEVPHIAKSLRQCMGLL